MKQVCPICSVDFLGDVPAFEHHVNTCLDVGPSTPTKPPSSPGKSSRDAENGLALSKQVPSSSSLSLIQNEPTRIDPKPSHHQFSGTGEGGGGGGTESCPICGLGWTDLEVSAASEVEKLGHVQDCIAASQGEEGGKGSWEDGNRDRQLALALANGHVDADADLDGQREDDIYREGFADGSVQAIPMDGRKLGGISEDMGIGKGKSKPNALVGQVTGTSGLIPHLASLLSRSHSSGSTRSATLCHDGVEHIRTSLMPMADLGWGCGYRNAQMLFSAARHLSVYKTHLLRYCSPTISPSTDDTLAAIPTVDDLRGLTEDAWKQGYDQTGAKHFKYKLRGARRWIGTTEVYVMMTILGIRTRIIDFPKSSGGDKGTQVALTKWVLEYFSSPTPSFVLSRTKSQLASNGSEGDVLDRLMESKGTAVKRSGKMPLYLQHQGHSRTIVGVEVGKNGECWLLLYDPGKKCPDALSKAVSPRTRPQQEISSNGAVQASKRLKTIFSRNAASGSGELADLDVSSHAKLLGHYRVSLKSLTRSDQYQILCIEDGPPLTEAERQERKVVRSITIQ